jgi:hypothetical protein
VNEGTAAPAAGDRRSWAIAAAAAAVVAFLPFARGVSSGQAFFFRDLSRQFFPLRLFALEGLRQGELRFWNPYDNEGVPLSLMPAGYPLELLQALWPTPSGLTLVMAFHFPLAAAGLVLLARHLGLRPVAAAGGAIVYALGGFALATVSLYVYVHAIAWTPLAVWSLLRAAEGGRRRLAMAALFTAIALATTGVELVAQGLLLAAALSVRGRDLRPLLRVAAAAALGAALSAPVLTALASATIGTARAAGFSSDAVLNQSVHPFTFVQVVVADLYGKLSNVANEWWGVNFFENGFPYVVSLYLGAAALSLAAAGLASRHDRRWTLAIAGALAVVVCLGRWGGWAPLVDWVPPTWRVFRFPTKAFFLLHTVVALLAACALDALADGQRRTLRVLLVAALTAASLLCLAPALPVLAPRGTAWFLAHFFPQALGPAARALRLDHMLADAAGGGLMTLALAAVAGLAAIGRLGGAGAAGAAAAIVAADLLRAGAGINPMADPSFFRVAPEVARLMAEAKPVRLHACDPMRSRAYWTARARRPTSHEVFTFVAMRDSLIPHYNVGAHVATALGEDTTGLVPLGRTLQGRSCRQLDALVPRLRDAAVTHLTSLDPLDSPDLAPLATYSSPALAPAVVHVYALRDPRPRFALLGSSGSVVPLDESTDTLAIDVDADAPASVLVRDGYGAGWRATLDGQPVAISEHEGRHRRVAVPAGPHRLQLRYRPPGWSASLWTCAAGAVLLAWLVLAGRSSPTG